LVEVANLQTVKDANETYTCPLLVHIIVLGVFFTDRTGPG
jgi:hypothetical protein